MREKSSETSSPNGISDCSTKSGTKKDEDAPCFSLPVLDTQVSQTSTLSDEVCESSHDGHVDDKNFGENNPSFSQTVSDDDSKFRKKILKD